MIGKAVARAMVAPSRKLPPCGRPFGYPSPGAGNQNADVQLRSSTAVAANIHGIRGSGEVTVRSHRLEGAVMVVVNAGQVPVFVGCYVGSDPDGRRSAAPRDKLFRSVAESQGD